ncbi:hypothetical protein N9937_00465 [bacterium]|nr:hypothetical protein [bacterium]
MSFVLVTGGTTRGITSTDEAQLTAYAFDATVNFSPRRSAVISSHPIESGSNISDHTTVKNLTIDVEGIVGTSRLPRLTGSGISGDVLDLSDPEITRAASGPPSRTHSVVAVLTKIFDQREIITVASEYEVFANCIVTALSFPKTAREGDSVKITMTLEQIQVVNPRFATMSTTLLDYATTTFRRGGKPVKKSGEEGTQTEKEFMARTIERLGELGDVFISKIFKGDDA